MKRTSQPISTVASQLLRWSLPVIMLLAACGIYRVTRVSTSDDSLATLPNQPNVVPVRYDLPLVATDQQLFEVLNRVLPPEGPAHTNNYVHALRLWGPQAKFANPKVPDGATMLSYFLDDATFRKLAGNNAPPLFRETDGLIDSRAWQEADPHNRTGAVHVDDLLATLAESGVPLDAPLKMRDGVATVGDLLRSAMRRFHHEQHEYEWTAISYARYLFPAKRWKNQYGQPIDLDGLVDELLEQPLPNGVCGGTHRLEALVVLARIDDQVGALSRRSRRKLIQHLGGVSQRLIAAQQLEGYWTRSWTTGSQTSGEENTAETDSSLYERILLTGHHLEWLALAPPEVQPPREVIVRAGQWLVRALLEAGDSELRDRYGPCTHAARALCLWRGKDPYHAWRQGQLRDVVAQAE